MNEIGEAAAEKILYIGTHKLIAAEVSLEGQAPRVIRYAIKKDPEGFEKGLVSHIEKAAASLEALLKQLDIAPAGPEVALSCSVILGNAKLKSYAYSSSVYYQGLQRTVSQQEIRQVIRQTRSVATLPLTEFVLQALPQSFIVNDTEGVENPVGLEAHRLGVDLRIHTMSFQDFKNICKAFEAAEIEVNGYFPKSAAVSEAVLTTAEKAEGALVIDIADEVTHLSIWKDNRLVATRILSCGGAAFTAEIAREWGIEARDARKVKEKFGTFETAAEFGGELIPIVDRTTDGNHQVKRQVFQQKFLEQGKQWLSEILQAADQFARENKVLHPHYIYTGGASGIEGFLEFLQKAFSRTGRLGLAKQVEAPQEFLVDPSAAAVLGLARWLSDEERDQRQFLAPRGFLEKTLASAKDFFTAYF
jgi:cell division protein FtsA